MARPRDVINPDDVAAFVARYTHEEFGVGVVVITTTADPISAEVGAMVESVIAARGVSQPEMEGAVDQIIDAALNMVRSAYCPCEVCDERIKRYEAAKLAMAKTPDNHGQGTH